MYTAIVSTRSPFGTKWPVIILYIFWPDGMQIKAWHHSKIMITTDITAFLCCLLLTLPTSFLHVSLSQSLHILFESVLCVLHVEMGA